MVQRLIQEGLLKSQGVISAMTTVPRELFVSESLRPYAYSDTPLPTGQGQTISAPHSHQAGRYMVAIMNEALELRPRLKVLEVGAGSGYHAATIAEQIGPDGRVYAIERVPELVKTARENLQGSGYSDRVIIVQGDGSVGYADRAPYDRILVTAAAPKVPQLLVRQLIVGGVLIVPVGGRMFPQELLKIRKKRDGRQEQSSLGGVAFVPLLGEEGFEG